MGLALPCRHCSMAEHGGMCRHCQRPGAIPAVVAGGQVLPITLLSWDAEQPLPPCRQGLQGSFPVAGRHSPMHVSPMLGQDGAEPFLDETPPKAKTPTSALSQSHW